MAKTAVDPWAEFGAPPLEGDKTEGKEDLWARFGAPPLEAAQPESAEDIWAKFGAPPLEQGEEKSPIKEPFAAQGAWGSRGVVSPEDIPELPEAQGQRRGLAGEVPQVREAFGGLKTKGARGTRGGPELSPEEKAEAEKARQRGWTDYYNRRVLEQAEASRAPETPGLVAHLGQRYWESLGNQAENLGLLEPAHWLRMQAAKWKPTDTGTGKEALAKLREGDLLGAASQIGGVAEDFLGTSLGDMITMASPAYTQGIVEERATNRAENLGKRGVEDEDRLAVLPFALAEVGLNYAALGGHARASAGMTFRDDVTGKLKDVTGSTVLKEAGKEALRGARREALTEATQENLQIIAETAGTPMQLTGRQIAERLGVAAVAGAFLGGGISLPASVYNQSQELRALNDQLDQNFEQRRRNEYLADLVRQNIPLDEYLGLDGIPENLSPADKAEMRDYLIWARMELDALGKEMGGLVKPGEGFIDTPFDDQTTRGKQQQAQADYYTGLNISAIYRNSEDRGSGILLDKSSFGTHPDSRIIAELTVDVYKSLAKAFGLSGDEVLITWWDRAAMGAGTFREARKDSPALNILHVNPSKIIGWARQEGLSERSVVVGAVAHEFGHHILQRAFLNMPLQARRALMAEYRTWLRNPQRLSLKKIFEQYTSALFNTASPAWMAQQVQVKPDYWGSFHEFFAQQVSRYVTSRGTAIFDQIDADMQAAARELEARYKELAKSVPLIQKRFPAFELFLDSVRIRKAMGDNPYLWTEDNTSGLARESMPPGVPEPSDPVKVLQKIGQEFNLPPEVRNSLEESGIELATFNRFVKYALTLPQSEKENRNVPGVSQFVQNVRKWWAEKSLWNNRASETLRFARSSNIESRKEELKAFEKFATRMTVESTRKGRKLKPEEIQALKEETRVSEAGLELWERMQKDFGLAINKLQQVTEIRIRNKFAMDPILLDKKLKEVRKDFALLRARDFFPLARFGRFAVTVKAENAVNWDGKTWKKGEVMYHALWESRADSLSDLERVRQEIPGAATTRKIGKGEANYIDLPDSVVSEFRDLAMEEYIATHEQATEEEIAEFRKKLSKSFELASLQYTPEESFRRRLMKRKATPGFSTDALRAYGAYMQSFGNYITRIENSIPILEALDTLGRHAARASKDPRVPGREVHRLDELKQALGEHYDYLVNPGPEWAGLRALGAHLFLGFSPRAALVNLVQVPSATYSHLAGKYSDIRKGKLADAEVVMEIAKAIRWLPKMFKTGTDAGLPWDLAQALQQGFEAGFLDEGLATELGVYAEGGNLRRALPGWVPGGRKINYGLKQYMHYSMWMFQQAEKANRLVTFKAAYELEKKRQLRERDLESIDDAPDSDVMEDILQASFAEAREVVETTQGEYARWARPRAMQGRKSSLFLFKLYIQHMLYLIAREPGGVRFLATQLALAGAMGLPFADDLMNLVKFLLRQIPGNENKPVDTQRMVREGVTELAEALDMAPDLLLYGAGGYGFGGWNPFDLSASLSLGTIVPGTDLINREGDMGGPYETIGRGVEAVGGPLASPVVDLIRAVGSKEMDDWKRWEKALPAKYLQNLSASARWAVRGEETGFRGEQILDFDPHNPAQAVEIIGKALGATPLRLREKREISWAQKQSARFYDARRRMLMRQGFEAHESKDREVAKDFQEALGRYNKEVPFRELQITREDLRKSLRSRILGQHKAEAGLPDSMRNFRLYKDVEASFPSRVEESAP